MGPHLISYRSRGGPRAGVAVDGVAFDAATLFDDPALSCAVALVAAWNEVRGRVPATLAADHPAAVGPVDAVALAAPLRPGAIYCAGANYVDHSANMAAMLSITPDPPPDAMDPWFFLKTPHCVAAPGVTVVAPSPRLDWEGELAAVIGTTARDVAVADALRHVMGYTVANDLSARDRIKRRGAPADSPFLYDFVGQKVFDGSCPLGPWIVPAEDVPDPQALHLRTSVNGVVRQDASTALMTYPLARQIAHLSSRLTLHPGDVILTGTPAGVGGESGTWLAPGDEVAVAIERIGTLVTRIG